MRFNTLLVLLFTLTFGLFSDSFAQQTAPQEEVLLEAIQNENEGIISIFRGDEDDPILIQNAQPDIRPYLHPIAAPDGNGILTQLRPDHHTHQTGLYWGLKRVNERDYFMACCKPGQTGYYRRVSANVLVPNGEQIKWQTVYDLLNEDGQTILTETQTWSLKQHGDEFVLDLEWQGQAKMDVTVGEYFVGGLFLRMPWHEGIAGEAVNAPGKRIMKKRLNDRFGSTQEWKLPDGMTGDTSPFLIIPKTLISRSPGGWTANSGLDLHGKLPATGLFSPKK